MTDHPPAPARPRHLARAWAITALAAASLLALAAVCQPADAPLAEHERVALRTALYAAAIAALPLNRLLRHILLKLGQTMPCVHNGHSARAGKRYTRAVTATLLLPWATGLAGVVLYWLGDGLNTLCIFLGLSALGLLLHRPRAEELEAIAAGLAAPRRP